MTFPATSQGARAARMFASEVVESAGAPVDEIALVVSELAANAVLHAATPFTVALTCTDAAVTIEVEDRNPVLPQVKDHGAAAPTGRGLHIVQQLTKEWGVKPTSDGKVVWVTVEPSEQTVA
jgi:anti-sigma regulatory factor (Ser/Thr protein kinase)